MLDTLLYHPLRLGWFVEKQTAALNRRLRGYPRNHDYALLGTRLLPGRRLRQRLRMIEPLYPRPVGKFLDIGSCKGFFVLQAALRGDCPLAVGIDVFAPFVEVARDVAARVGLNRASFYYASLEEVAADPVRFGGPFDTVQLVSTYHYLYWGSDLESKSFNEHAAILEMLAKLCSGTLVFANPLEVADCPAIIQKKAASRPHHDYTAAGFKNAAQRLFDVRAAGHMDPSQRKRPLLVLTRR